MINYFSAAIRPHKLYPSYQIIVSRRRPFQLDHLLAPRSRGRLPRSSWYFTLAAVDLRATGLFVKALAFTFSPPHEGLILLRSDGDLDQLSRARHRTFVVLPQTTMANEISFISATNGPVQSYQRHRVVQLLQRHWSYQLYATRFSPRLFCDAHLTGTSIDYERTPSSEITKYM
jgi:hypothetical protein